MSEIVHTDMVTDAREIAAYIAMGKTPEQVANEVDLPHSYVLECTEHEAFLPALEKVGGKSALDIWNEYKVTRQSRADLKGLVRENMAEYFKFLNDIAQDTKVKSEVRFATMKFLIQESGILSETVSTPVMQELPAMFLTKMVQAERELEEMYKKHGITDLAE
jgi:hypothetical protein